MPRAQEIGADRRRESFILGGSTIRGAERFASTVASAGSEDGPGAPPREEQTSKAKPQSCLGALLCDAASQVRRARGPKIAVPTRTMVAPSSMAAS